MIVTRAREPANPPDLGSGEARGGTGARDHFDNKSSRGRTDAGVRLLSGIMQVQFLPGAPQFPGDVKVACPSVKRVVVVRVHIGEPFHTERVRLVEEAVLKTVTPSQVSGVQIPGAPPISYQVRSFAFRRLAQGTPIRAAVRGDPAKATASSRLKTELCSMPAWCNSSTADSQSANLGA
jgi:hypothetical protein